MKMRKIDWDDVKRSAKNLSADDIVPLQVAVYIACGGGMLGSFAAEQPADFYIDARVSGLPFSKRVICNQVKALAIIASAKGLDPHNLPRLPLIPYIGILINPYKSE